MATNPITDDDSTDTENSDDFEMLTDPIGEATHEYRVTPDVFLEALETYVEYVEHGRRSPFDDFLANNTTIGGTFVHVELVDDTSPREFMERYDAIDVPDAGSVPMFALTDKRPGKGEYTRTLDVDEEFLDEDGALPEQLTVEVNDDVTPDDVAPQTARYERVE